MSEDIQYNKKLVAKETLLSYPKFNKPFVIHKDARQLQLGAGISQDDKPIAFYGRKLNTAQVNNTTTECKILSKVETLKEFRNMIFGQKIKVYTDIIKEITASCQLKKQKPNHGIRYVLTYLANIE